MRVILSDQYWTLLAASDSRLPGIAKRHVSRGQQAGQISQRAPARHQAGKRPRRPAQLLTKSINESPFNGSRPGAHFINRHHLIGD